MTRITDIVDNRAAEGFVAEHGLSLLIEHGNERILFDTGAGTALRPNAAKLGVDLCGVTRIVLSHSHNDHTGGLGGLAPKCPIHVGDGFDVPCFSKHADGSVHSLVVPPDAQAVLEAADVRVGRQFGEIAKGVYLSGRIERTSGEDNGKSFYCDESCAERNYVLEEQALLTEDGVLVTGCVTPVSSTPSSRSAAPCHTSQFARLSADFTCAMRRTMRLNGRANSSDNSSSTNSSSFTARAKRRARGSTARRRG